VPPAKKRNLTYLVNHVKGKFGQGKNGYELNEIRARRKDTSESWISAILFVMKLTKLLKLSGRYVYFLFSILCRYCKGYLLSLGRNYLTPGPVRKLIAA